MRGDKSVEVELLPSVFSIILGDVPDMGFQLLRHLPAGDGCRSKDLGQLVVGVDDPAVPPILEAEVLDVEPQSSGDLGPAEPPFEDDGLQGVVHLHQGGQERKASRLFRLPCSASHHN